MSALRTLIARVIGVFRHRRSDAELSAEIESHLDALAEAHRRNGIPRQAAWAAARREFGGVEQMKEQHRDARSFPWFEHMRRDGRQAFRALRSAPGHSAVIIATLGLGIGASVGIFSVVYGVLMRPLPYRAADRLVAIRATQQLDGAPRPMPAPFDFATLQPTVGSWRSFEHFVFSSVQTSTLASAEGSEMLDTAVVSAGFLPVLGGRTVIGRPLASADDLNPVVVISERLWAHRFRRSPSILGQTLTLQSVPYTVVGVLEEAFQLPESKTDVWMPLGFLAPQAPRGYSLWPIATLKPGVSLDAAHAEVSAWAATLSNDRQYMRHRVTTTGLLNEMTHEAKRPLLTLLAAVLLLLMVACANVANLLLTRNMARAREWDVRSALGASRGRLYAQRLTEVSVLALGGTVVGVALAYGFVALLPRIASGIPRLNAIGLDSMALTFAAGLSVLVTTVTGTLSAWPPPVWRQSGTATESRTIRRLRQTLCTVELAVALVLLVGATLLGRTFAQLLGADIGASTAQVVSASLFFPGGVRQPDARVRDIARRIEQRLAAIPGVQDVGIGTSLPLTGSRIRITLADDAKKVASVAAGVPATPGYFRALGMRLVEGRFFTDADDDQHPPVGILTEETARRYFPDGQPVGRTMLLPVLRAGVGGGQVEVTVVGIVKNVKYSTVDADPEDAMYRPFAQQAWGSPFLVVRSTRDPDAMSTLLRKEVAAVDPEIVVSLVRSLDDVVLTSLAAPRFRAVVVGWLAFAAVALAAVGLAGAIAYAVSRRTAEFGVRLALGATKGDVLRLVYRETAVVITAGTAVGAAVSLGASRLLITLLYEVTSTDPWSFVGSIAGLGIVALAATYLPARRAASVQPLIALRTE